MSRQAIRILDKLNERTLWAYAIVSMIAQHDDTDDDVRERSACAARQLERVRELLRDLWALHAKEPA